MKFDLEDPALWRYGTNHEVFDEIRATDPVYWQDEKDPEDGHGYWSLSRHEDIRRVELDHETFSNEPTVSISNKNQVGDETHRHLIFSDPPHHTAHRELLAPEVGLARIRPARESMKHLVDSIVDLIIEDGNGDLVFDLSGKMASFALADLLGLEREHSLEMFDAAALLTRAISTTEGPGLEATQILFKHASDAYVERMETPRDDTLSRIAHAEIMGIPVDDFQFMVDFQLLVSAGSDTSRNLLATGMLTLMDHPEAYAQIVENPALLPKALEEMLRYTPPIVAMRRTVTKDIEFGGKQMKKGDKIVMHYGAANRDPEVFENPHTFDIHRKVNNHLTFGGGIHHCMGAHLARLELLTMFGAMISRMPDMKLAGEPDWPELGEAPMISGPHSVPISFTPGQRVTTGEVAPIFG